MNATVATENTFNLPSFEPCDTLENTEKPCFVKDVVEAERTETGDAAKKRVTEFAGFVTGFIERNAGKPLHMAALNQFTRKIISSCKTDEAFVEFCYQTNRHVTRHQKLIPKQTTAAPRAKVFTKSSRFMNMAGRPAGAVNKTKRGRKRAIQRVAWSQPSKIARK